MQDLGKRISRLWLNERMRMVWHYDEGVEPVTFAVKMSQRVPNYFCRARIAQHALAVAFV